MGPDRTARRLEEIADYIESGRRPSRDRVAGEISLVLSAISGRHEAADLRDFMQPEIQGSLAGIDALIARLDKVIKTLGQSPNLKYLQRVRADLSRARDDFETQLEDFYNVEI